MRPLPDDDQVRCAGCGKHYSRQFIRCWACHTLTRDSEEAERLAERTAARRRGIIVIPAVTIVLWGIIALIVMALT